MKTNPARRHCGEVVYIYAFDVAYDTARKPIRELLGQPVAQFVVDASKRSPRQLFFYKPQMVRLPPMERIGPLGAVRNARWAPVCYGLMLCGCAVALGALPLAPLLAGLTWLGWYFDSVRGENPVA